MIKMVGDEEEAGSWSGPAEGRGSERLVMERLVMEQLVMELSVFSSCSQRSRFVVSDAASRVAAHQRARHCAKTGLLLFYGGRAALRFPQTQR